MVFISLAISVVQGQEMCATPPVIEPLPAAAFSPPDPNADYCVNVRAEVAYDIFQRLGSNTLAETEALLSEVSALYADNGITLTFDIHVWETPSPYTGVTSGDFLTSFRNNALPHQSDLAILLSTQASGGIAWVNTQCNRNYGYSFASIRLSHEPYPAYSWDVMVIAHELGHNLGSPHTHACVWNGNNTAIDGCAGFTEGNCDNPGSPSNGGTVMSYCHFTTGIDFRQGFGPQPLALMKNRIASAACAECDDTPPPPVECENHEVVIEIMPDAYPMEIRYELATDNGEILASGGPWVKDQRWVIQTDSLCLEDGCYRFVIRDVDGLSGQPGGDGGWYLNNGENTLGSGIDFTDSVVVNFCLGDITTGCQDILFADLESFSTQDYGYAEILNDGEKMYIQGNAWKVMPFPYDVTPNTILSFDFKNVIEGEIQGICFAPSTQSIYPLHTIRIAGTQQWGYGGYDDDIVTTGFRHYDIAIGQYYQQQGLLGEYPYFAIINDMDGHPRNAEAYWKAVTICEGDPNDLPPLPSAISIGQEPEIEEVITGLNAEVYGKKQGLYPNPAKDTVHLPYEVQYQVFPMVGKRLLHGYGKSIDVSTLKPGMYAVVYGGIIEKVIIE